MRDANVFLKHLRSLLAFVIGFLYSIFRLIQPIETEITTNNSNDVVRFVNEFERKYGKTHLEFCQTDYLRCVDEAMLNSNHLLLYLHGDDHEESDQFCRQSLCDQTLLEFVKQSCLRCWACNINSDEGACVSRIVREHSYPFVGLLMTGINNRMYLVARSEGMRTGPQLVAFLRDALCFNVKGSNGIIRDDCRVIQVPAERNAAVPEHQESDQRTIDSTESWRSRRMLVISSLPPLPEPPQPPLPAIALRARFASGALIERRFSPEDPVSVLVKWIMSAGEQECPRYFRVVSNTFPSHEISCRLSSGNEFSPDLGSDASHERSNQLDLSCAGLVSNTTLYVLECDE